MKQRECFCGGAMEKVVRRRKGIVYEAYQCEKCNEVVLDMGQAEAYMKAAEKAKEVTFSTWGQSLAVRIPKDLVQALHLKPKDKAKIIAEKDGFRILPIPG